MDVLDQYFECIAAPIEDSGGEILKFIGDAILAVFPFDDAKQNSCDDILDAAQQALENLKAWSAKKTKVVRPHLEVGIALHIGKMLYGNVGGRSRLDFTVIGSAVNEAARIEGLCKTTFPLLATKAFEQYVNKGRMASIGKKKLRGVNEEHELFTLAEFK